MAALGVCDFFYAAGFGASAASDAGAGLFELFADEMGEGDVACGAEDVEDWGAEVGEAGCGVVALGAVESEDWGSVWVEIVVGGGAGRVSDEFADGIDGRPKGTDECEDLLVLSCSKTDRSLRFVLL